MKFSYLKTNMVGKSELATGRKRRSIMYHVEEYHGGRHVKLEPSSPTNDQVNDSQAKPYGAEPPN